MPAPRYCARRWRISRRENLWKRREVEKSKIDFPTSLGNPANTRGIPTFPTASAAAVYKTNSCRTDGDISNEVRLGTFLSSYDIRVGVCLTRHALRPILRENSGQGGIVMLKHSLVFVLIVGLGALSALGQSKIDQPTI